jgi:6-phosphogluconolactonase
MNRIDATRDDGIPFVYVAQDDDHISTFRLNSSTGELSLVANTKAGRHPSFLAFAPSKRFVYAVNEFSNELAAFEVDPRSGELSFLNRVASGGAEPAFVSVDATGQWVFVANYRTGPVAVFRVSPDGSLGAQSDANATGKHPHAILLDRSNRFGLVPNIGSDEIAQLKFDARRGELFANEPRAISMRPGAEPRHFAFHPTRDFVYVVEESGSQVDAYAFDASKGTLSPIGSISSLPDGADRSGNTGSDVHASPSGEFLYASNRGHDSIVICAIGEDGGLTLVGHEGTRGKTPRNFGIDPTGAFLLAANKDSQNVAVFSIDCTRGTLRHLATTTTGAAPYWVGAVTLPGP